MATKIFRGSGRRILVVALSLWLGLGFLSSVNAQYYPSSFSSSFSSPSYSSPTPSYSSPTSSYSSYSGPSYSSSSSSSDSTTYTSTSTGYMTQSSSFSASITCSCASGYTEGYEVLEWGACDPVTNIQVATKIDYDGSGGSFTASSSGTSTTDGSSTSTSSTSSTTSSDTSTSTSDGTSITTTTDASDSGASATLDSSSYTTSGTSQSSSGAVYVSGSCPPCVKTERKCNGECGSSDGQALTVAPTADLCEVGDPVPVNISNPSAVNPVDPAYPEGPWDWNCEGYDGGTTTSPPCQTTPTCLGSTLSSSNIVACDVEGAVEDYSRNYELREDCSDGSGTYGNCEYVCGGGAIYSVDPNTGEASCVDCDPTKCSTQTTCSTPCGGGTMKVICPTPDCSGTFEQEIPCNEEPCGSGWRESGT